MKAAYNKADAALKAAPTGQSGSRTWPSGRKKAGRCLEATPGIEPG
jgi:hypothetical protein